MTFFIFIFCFLFSLNLSAKDENKDEFKESYDINLRYKAGAYLIYDCEKSHYACVDAEGSNVCSLKRKMAIKDKIENKIKAYPCAPLLKFKTKRDCILRSYQIVDLNHKRRFCSPK